VKLNDRDVRAIYHRSGEPERALMRDLLAADDREGATVLADILAYFPGAMLDSRFRGRRDRYPGSSPGSRSGGSGRGGAGRPSWSRHGGSRRGLHRLAAGA
jgi:hypothetical protein